MSRGVECLSEFFVLWDEDDRLVLCNDVFRRINAEIVEYTEPGTPLDAHLRAGMERGLYPESDGREEEWLVDRIERHRNPTGPFETRRRDGRWLLINGQRLLEGGIVTAGIDITEQKHSEYILRRSRDELEDRVLIRTSELSKREKELEDSYYLLQ